MFKATSIAMAVTVLISTVPPVSAHGGGGGGGGHGGGGGGHSSFGGGGHSFGGSHSSFSSFSHSSFGSSSFGHSSFNHSSFGSPSSSGSGSYNHSSANPMGTHTSNPIGNEHAVAEPAAAAGAAGLAEHGGAEAGANANHVMVSMPTKSSTGLFGHIHRMFGGNPKTTNLPEQFNATPTAARLGSPATPAINQAISPPHSLTPQPGLANQALAPHQLATGAVPHTFTPASAVPVAANGTPVISPAMNNAFMQQRMQLAALGSTANAYPWSSGVFNSLHSGYGGMMPYGMGTNFGGFGTGSGYYPGMMPGLGGYGAGFGGYGSSFGGMGGYGMPYGAGYGGYGGYGGGLGSSMAMGAGMTGLFYLLSGLFSSHAGYGAYGFGSGGYAPNAGAYSMGNYGVGAGGYGNAYGAGAPYSYDPNQPSSFPAYGYGYPNGGGQNGYPDPSAATGYNAGGNSGYVAPFSGGAAPNAPDVNAFNADGNNVGYPNNQMTGMVPNDGMAKLQEPNDITDNSNVSGYRIDRPNQLAYNPVNGAAYTGPQGTAPEQQGAAGNAQSPPFTAKNYMLPNKNGWLNTYFQNQSPAYSYYMQHRSNALWMALAHDTGAPTTGENSALAAKDEKTLAPDATPDTTSPFDPQSP